MYFLLKMVIFQPAMLVYQRVSFEDDHHPPSQRTATDSNGLIRSEQSGCTDTCEPFIKIRREFPGTRRRKPVHGKWLVALHIYIIIYRYIYVIYIYMFFILYIFINMGLYGYSNDPFEVLLIFLVDEISGGTMEV